MLTDEQLLRAYQDADPKGFDGFFRRRHQLVFGYLLAKLGSRAEAEDALQETFLRVHRSILVYDSSRSALNWVFAIARNVMIDLRHKRGVIAEATDSLTDTGLSAENLLLVRQELDRLLQGLRPEERDLLVSRYVDGESAKETAARTGLTLDNTKQRFSRILRKVRAAGR